MIYVSPYLGAGADWLAVVDASLVPLVSWMGGKRRLAPRILAALDLAPGRVLLGRRVGDVPPCLLGDASWWGWVWPVVLDPVTGPRVSEVLRSWRGEDPRALWFRLRDLGPLDDPAEAAAQLLWLQARAASGVPVWWEGQGVVSMDGHGRGPYPAWQATCRPAERPDLLVAPGDGRERQRAHERTSTPRLLQEASTQVDDAGQRQARDPRLLALDGRNVPRVTGQRTSREERLVATTRGGQEPGAPFEAGHKGTDSRGGGGIVDPGTIAARADAIRARLVKASGGDAAPGPQDGWCAKMGWRVLQPQDIADRADRIRSFDLGDIRIEHCDARALTERYAAEVGVRGRVYLDPPYQGATGYPAQSSRADVLWIAEEWARHGARVVLSEAVGLAGELGAGWTQECLRDEGKPEWITTYEGRLAA